MIKLLLWLWQLPQNLIGFIYSRFGKKCSVYYNIDGKVKLYTWYFVPCFRAGVSLGQYIILDPLYKELAPECHISSLNHETGHSIQSKYLGPVYLLVVGIPSAIRNIWDRLFHKNWTSYQRIVWYYKGYPEHWADKLGGNI